MIHTITAFCYLGSSDDNVDHKPSQHRDITLLDPCHGPGRTAHALQLQFSKFHLQHDSTATSNVGPAERWSAQAYTVKLPPVVLLLLSLCRASFPPLPCKRFQGVLAWRRHFERGEVECRYCGVLSPEKAGVLRGSGPLLDNKKTFISDKSQEGVKMGSRMNPECKIYIGGLPDDANK